MTLIIQTKIIKRCSMMTVFLFVYIFYIALHASRL